MGGVIITLGFFSLVAFLTKLWFDSKNKNTLKSIAFIAMMLSLSACGVEQVDEGFRGIRTKWGRVEGDPLTPGLYFYNPVSAGIFEMSVREEVLKSKTSVFTKDTQRVDVEYAVTFYPTQDKIGAIYSQFGKEWQVKIIEPAILGSLKDAIGQYIADDLVSKREIAKTTAENELKNALAKRSIIVTRLDFTNLDFDDQYEHAVEAKVTAIQRAAEAKNKTIQVEEEAKQTVATAKADAESMRIKSQALSQNKALIDFEAVKKWDGALPQIIMGGKSMPMIDLRGMTSKKQEE